jgi:coenzyme F420 hydrogenase subunit delta
LRIQAGIRQYLRQGTGMIQDIIKNPILILGCGNMLFGDDGFGPAVIEHLEAHCSLPETVLAMDMGTGIKEFLFDLIMAPIKPEHIFILDAISQPDRKAGDLFEIRLDRFQEGKKADRLFHQFPSIDQLQQLGSLTGVDIRILVVQVKEVPDTVRPGLSPEVKEAIPRACDWLIKEIGSEKN